MINSMQSAILKKDIKTMTTNKRLFPVLLIVPIVFTVVLPTIFVLILSLTPVDTPNFKEILAILPGADTSGDIRYNTIIFIVNTMIPIFFIIIPIMASSVMAASSFVGEKEKKTLETLLYCPLPLQKIFSAKIFASLFLSMLTSLASFILMIITLQIELMLLLHHNLSFDILNWIIMLFIMAPSFSLLAITLIVNGSAKAQTIEESQQRAVFLILPIFLLLIGQATGILMINALILLIVSAIVLILTWMLMKRATHKFTYELLLKV